MMHQYIAMFEGPALPPNEEPGHCRSNYWFNCVSCDTPAQRDAMTKVISDSSVRTRLIWPLMNPRPAYIYALFGLLDNAECLAAHVVNLPRRATFPKKVY
jgi:hypothetical protein